ncbi:hypothetical protein DSO57_1020891 [Entomophthora muscae]|uniref:Uncharacterized protein n=1 Tax=Entomophthora muscae TaxID=34485 RepID=A0ACC2TR76_9FUNG|nr:hypothetical protein DSO57_1020891 [Entomophthora muscae]
MHNPANHFVRAPNSWLLSHYVSYFKRHIADINHLSLRLLENFEACKAADPVASPALKEALRFSLINRVHGIIGRDDALPQSRSSLKSTLADHSLLTYVPDAMEPASAEKWLPQLLSPRLLLLLPPRPYSAPVTKPASAPSVATPPANVPVTASAPPLTQC